MRILLAIVLLLLSAVAPGRTEPTPAGSIPSTAEAGRPTGPVMPDLRGLTPEQARLRLKQAGIRGYRFTDAQVRQGVGRVVRQSPLPGSVVGPMARPPEISVGVSPIPRRPTVPSTASSPKRPPVRWWAWALMFLGTGGMFWLAREALHRWEPPPPPERPVIEVTKVTRPPKRKPPRR